MLKPSVFEAPELVLFPNHATFAISVDRPSACTTHSGLNRFRLDVGQCVANRGYLFSKKHFGTWLRLRYKFINKKCFLAFADPFLFSFTQSRNAVLLSPEAAIIPIAFKTGAVFPRFAHNARFPFEPRRNMEQIKMPATATLSRRHQKLSCKTTKSCFTA